MSSSDNTRKPDPRRDVVRFVDAQRRAEQADAGVHGMLAAGKAAQHHTGRGEIGRLVQGLVAEGHGGVRAEDERVRMKAGDRRGLQAGVMEDHLRRIRRRILVLGDRGHDHAMRQAGIPEGPGAAWRGGSKDERKRRRHALKQK
jgi:hypothetical protein